MVNFIHAERVKDSRLRCDAWIYIKVEEEVLKIYVHFIMWASFFLEMIVVDKGVCSLHYVRFITRNAPTVFLDKWHIYAYIAFSFLRIIE